MNIKIRHAEPSDYEAFRETMSQPAAQSGTLQLPLPSLDMWKKRLEAAKDTDKVLVAEVDGKVVGNLGLHQSAPSLRRRHAYGIGMAIHDAYHRKGVGSALMKAGLDLADNWMQIKRLELEVYTDNAPAIALYKKFGFEIEGTLRMHAFRDGKYVDSYVMSRLKP
jgi:L-phenylalanine/L-methionine N-acetyltransferase